jgi:hypothetical protein
VTADESSSCLVGSVADAGRPDGWRCVAGNAILDPCFASPFALSGDTDMPVCAESRFTNEVVRLTLTEPLPAEANPPDPTLPPWALELANGEQCTLRGGATAGCP